MTNEQIESLAKQIGEAIKVDQRWKSANSALKTYHDFDVDWNKQGIQILVSIEGFQYKRVPLNTNNLTKAEYRLYENLINGFGVSEPIGTASAIIDQSGCDYWCDPEDNDEESNTPVLEIVLLPENVQSEWHAVGFIEDVIWQFEAMILPLFE